MSQAPNIETLFDFETQLEAAFRSTIKTITNQPVFSFLDVETLTVPRIELRITVNEPVGANGMPQVFGVNPAAFAAGVDILLITRRVEGQTNSLRGLLRYRLSPGLEQVNDSLEWLEVLSLTPQSTERGVDTEETADKLDQTRFSFTMHFGIKPQAWPE